MTDLELAEEIERALNVLQPLARSDTLFSAPNAAPGCGLTALFALLPMEFPKMNPLITYGGMGLGGFIALWGFWPLLCEGWGRLLKGRSEIMSSTLPRQQSVQQISDRWTWAPLTRIEIDNIYDALRDKGQRSIHVACNNQQCAGLADSLVELFKRLGWPNFVGDGLFDATGARGLSLNPEDETARILRAAIEAHTELRIDIVRNPRAVGDITPTMLIIGSKM